jgi:hypothetical protein
MRINEAAVDRFRTRLHEMGEEVSEADAKGRFLALLAFVYLVAQTPPEETDEEQPPQPRPLPPVEWFREPH